jgi:hypothetical protein
VDDPEVLLDQSDVIVIGHRAPEFTALLPRLRPEQVVVDLAGGGNARSTNARYETLGG